MEIKIIKTETDYEAALARILELMDAKQDTPEGDELDALGTLVEAYEAQDEKLTAFVEGAEAMPTEIVLLRTLMRQYGLTDSNLPEIGDKTMVSEVLNGKRILQRHSIDKLAERFGIRPEMFLGD